MSEARSKSFCGQPRRCWWTLRIQGACVEVSKQWNWSFLKNKKKRKDISEFSHQSRMRMLRTCNYIDWKAVGPVQFVTLTYPDDKWDYDYAGRSKQRYLFHRYLETWKKFYVPMLWRVEWKPRLSGRYKGSLAPHIHLMVLGHGEIPEETVRSTWKGILGTNNFVDVDSRPIVGQDGAIRYISKYMAKVYDLDIATYRNSSAVKGRHWGIHRKGAIPLCPVVVDAQLTLGDVERLKAERDKLYTPSAGSEDFGFTLFGNGIAARLGWEFSDLILNPGEKVLG